MPSVPKQEDDGAMPRTPSTIPAGNRPPASTLTLAEFIRIYPRIAGGAETDEEKAAREKAEADAAAAKAKADADAAAEKAAKAEKDNLGPAGKAALDAERQRSADLEKRAKAAEKAAKDAQAKLDKIEADGLSESEKLKKEAEEGRTAAATATEKLRKANLIAALSKKDSGVADARAAAGLIAGVEYDDNDEPTNLADQVKTLIDDYPLLKGKGAGSPNLNGNEGGNEGDPPQLTAEELQMAESFGMTPEEYAKEKDPAYQGEPVKT